MPTARLVGILACLLVAINALAFTYAASIAVPSGDAWYFIDTFVRKAVSGDLGLLDFFAQRRAGDHSQPLHRLILLAHLHLGDLDFRQEALAGIAFAVACCAVLIALLLRRTGPSGADGRVAVVAVAVFSVGLSLNATNIYTWSLVSLGWLLLLVAVLYWIVAPRLGTTPKALVALGLLTFVMAGVLDEVALPVFAALIGAMLVRDRFRSPATVLKMAAAGAGGLILARAFLHLIAQGDAADASGGSVAAMLRMLLDEGGWKVVLAPLADSLVHREHLARWFPDHVVMVQALIAAGLGLCHLWFWRRAFDPARRPRDAVLLVAVAMMLFFYAAIVGIALSRASQFGSDYFHQPRYVAMYQLNIIALLLMYAGAAGAPAAAEQPGLARLVRRPGIALVLVLVALQVPLSVAAWGHAKYVRTYASNAAQTIVELGRDPGAPPVVGCPPTLVVCKAPAEVRMRIMTLLRTQQLSVYSPRFRRANGLDGLLDSDMAAGAASQAGEPPASSAGGMCSVPTVRGGPRKIVAGKPVHQQSDGRSAFWLQVPESTPDIRVELAGQSLPVVRRGGLVTFSVSPEKLAAVPPEHTLEFAIICGGRQVGRLDVQVVVEMP